MPKDCNQTEINRRRNGRPRIEGAKMQGARMQGAKMEGLRHGSNKVPGIAGLSLDIFQVEAGGVVWRGAAATLEDAIRRIQELASASPADYIRRSARRSRIKASAILSAIAKSPGNERISWCPREDSNLHSLARTST